MKRLSKNLILISISGLLLSACSYKVEKEREAPAKIDGASLSFAQVSSMALAPKCARCHAWATSYSGSAAVAFGDTGIGARVQSNTPGFMMPPASSPQLSANEKAAILAWVDAGAKEFPAQPDTPPVITPPIDPPLTEPQKLTFALIKQKVFAAKCLRCHGAELDTFEHTLPLIKDIEFRVQDIGGFDQMPPANRTQLTDEEKNMLLEWIRSGAPNE